LALGTRALELALEVVHHGLRRDVARSELPLAREIVRNELLGRARGSHPRGHRGNVFGARSGIHQGGLCAERFGFTFARGAHGAAELVVERREHFSCRRHIPLVHVDGGDAPGELEAEMSLVVFDDALERARSVGVRSATPAEGGQRQGGTCEPAQVFYHTTNNNPVAPPAQGRGKSGQG